MRMVIRVERVVPSTIGDSFEGLKAFGFRKFGRLLYRASRMAADQEMCGTDPKPSTLNPQPSTLNPKP